MAYPVSVQGKPPPYYHRSIATLPRNPQSAPVSLRRVRFIDPRSRVVQPATIGFVGNLPIIFLFN